MDELELAIGEVEHEKVDQELVVKALKDFGEVFDGLPPYRQKELFRLVVHKAVVSKESLELALYGKPPQLSEMTQGTARSGTSNWLPGLASRSAVPRDRLKVDWSRQEPTTVP